MYRFKAVLLARMVSGACKRSMRATSSTRGRSASSDGTTSLRSPSAFISSASKSFARSKSSFVLTTPIIAASRAVLRIERQLPTVRAMGKPNLAEGDPKRRSQAAAMPAPPPVHAPWMAATVGTFTSSMASKTRSIRASYSSPSCAVAKPDSNCEMSVPETKALPPAPRRTKTCTEGSRLVQISPSRSYIAKVMALRACGRLKVTKPIRSRTSKRMSSLMRALR